jgi:hypothetical protein
VTLGDIYIICIYPRPLIPLSPPIIKSISTVSAIPVSDTSIVIFINHHSSSFHSDTFNLFFTVSTTSTVLQSPLSINHQSPLITQTNTSSSTLQPQDGHQFRPFQLRCRHPGPDHRSYRAILYSSPTCPSSQCSGPFSYRV